MTKNFEQLFNEYMETNEKLKNENITLDEAIDLYKQSQKQYQKLKEKLDKSKMEIIEIKD
ncbi:MAG: exodeoxyribonuclease VII small subunit [Tissierellia bacterium]|nr:exodeoxyribonuclease VII small subunit [Tissierellia bacterium]